MYFIILLVTASLTRWWFCFRPFRRAKTFRFWLAFKDWKRGYREPVDRLREELFSAL